MSTSNNRSSRRKHRGKAPGNDNDGGLALLVSPPNANRTDFDSGISRHPYKKKDTYVPSSSRSGYNMSRDGPSSHPDSQDRFYKHPSEPHHRSGRDGYDTADSRDGDHWGIRKTHDTHHKGNREWATRESDQGYSAAPRSEQQRWGKSGFYDDRPHPNRESPDWRRGEPDDERGGNREPRARGNRRWQSDNGWDTRKRDRQQNRRPPDDQDESTQATEDRAWEPGPGWQPRGGGQGHRNQRPRNNYIQGKNKGKKVNQNRQRQRGDRERDRGRHLDRERRPPEDTLNKCVLVMQLLGKPANSGFCSWQRREIHPLPPRPRSPLKKALTPSRSRSQSPESFYSRRSSRSHSRSRSCSPQPNAYYSSPPRARSRSPPGRGREESQSRSPASSQRSRSNQGRLSRRRSISSSSSYSRSRSRSSSCSPDDRPKAKHRLPAVTSIMNISLSMSKTALRKRSDFMNSREPAFNRNGKLNGKQRVRRHDLQLFFRGYNLRPDPWTVVSGGGASSQSANAST
ncbi:hypothetical protein EV401DRAFT_499385 [Pisolithus croceorrhizus]|nr:hypothetical protein EV401DRAFT_499385 [Pisolithus croceorrhizus]